MEASFSSMQSVFTITWKLLKKINIYTLGMHLNAFTYDLDEY